MSFPILVNRNNIFEYFLLRDKEKRFYIKTLFPIMAMFPMFQL